MSASFTLNAQVILADKEYIRKIANIFKKIDIDIDGLIPVSLAERNLILDANELTDNVLLIDIGAGNTELGVFEGNDFIYTNTIPLGGDNITNDISIVLGISEEESAFLPHRYRERRQRHTRCPAAEGWNRQLPAFQRADSVRLCMRGRGSASCHCPVRFDSTDRIRFPERKGHRAKARLCAPACGEKAAERT